MMFSQFRQFVTDLLAKAPDEWLARAMHQLVHAVRYDRRVLQSPLLLLLFARAMSSNRILIAQYWALVACARNHQDTQHVTYSLLLESFCARIGAEKGMHLFVCFSSFPLPD